MNRWMPILRLRHLILILAICALCSAPFLGRASELGVNYNGAARAYSRPDVRLTEAKWVRAFVDVRKLQRSGAGGIASDPDLDAIARMHEDGYKVILSLKYDFANAPFPSNPTDPDFLALRAFTSELLKRVLPSVEVIVVGNEPFIESNPRNREGLVDFYKHMANHVITFDRNSGRHIALYVGAFNNLESQQARTPAVDGLFRYARNTPGIDGVDLHLHVSSLEQMRSAIEYAKGELGAGKQIISTEFSFKNYFKAQLGRPIDGEFALRWHVDPSWQVWQYLNFALRTPRSREEWFDFLHRSDWFGAVQSSLADADQLFDRQGLVVATYALRQTQPGLGPHTDPWILNALYCNQTCIPQGPGRPEPNFWMDSFRARQADKR